MPKEFSKSEDHKRIYATAVFGGFSIYDLRMSFIDHEEGQPVSRVEVVVPPLTAKQLASWLVKQVAEYEKMFGKIKDKPSPQATKELEKRKKAAKETGYN